jgi:hypothetical protein
MKIHAQHVRFNSDNNDSNERRTVHETHEGVRDSPPHNPPHAHLVLKAAAVAAAGGDIAE